MTVGVDDVMLKVLASALTVAAAPAAAPTPCPSGMVSMGETPDGAWAVCERTLTKDALSGDLVPAGELRFMHRNGTARSFRKTSKAMYGCNGQHANATDGCFMGGSPGPSQLQAGAQSLLPRLLSRIGNTSDPTHAQIEALWPAMVYDGGYNYADPAHQGQWKGRPDQSPLGLNAHTFVGSRR